MQKALFLIILLLSPIGVFAEKMDVVADIPSGTYHAPIHITLTPTEASAKTFYSFKPDGYPNDAFLYTGSILLKHSSPFIYFSFVSTSNESKIKQNDYIFDYPGTIRIGTDSFPENGRMSIILVNSGAESVNMGFWYIQSESDMVTIPEWVVLAAGERYIMNLGYTGTSAIVLRSPDDDEKDVFVPQGIPEWTVIRIPKKPVAATRAVPRKIISTTEMVPPFPRDGSTPLVTIVPSDIPSTSSLEPTSPTAVPKPAEVLAGPEKNMPDINQIVKVSTAESGQRNMNPLYLVALLMLSFGIGWFQWFMKRKQR